MLCVHSFQVTGHPPCSPASFPVFNSCQIHKTIDFLFGVVYLFQITSTFIVACRARLAVPGRRPAENNTLQVHR